MNVILNIKYMEEIWNSVEWMKNNVKKTPAESR